MDRLLSPKEAAVCLGCSEALIRKWMYSNQLPYVKVGRLSRVRESDLRARVRSAPRPETRSAGPGEVA